MSILDNWLDTYKRVLTQPSDFFETESRRDGFGFPLKFALVNLFIAGIVSSGSIAMFGGGVYGLGLGEMSALITAVFTPLIGIIGMIISALLIHIFVALLGGEKGYRETLSVIGYASVITPISSILSLIPILGGLGSLLLTVYGLFIQVKGLESFQEMSTGRALAAILLPLVIFAVIVFIIAIIILGGAIVALAA